MFTLSGLFGGSSVPVARKTYLTPPTTRFRPRVEGLEERTVPSAVAAAPQVAAQLAPVVPGAAQQAAPILNIDVSNIRVDPANASQLLADITANGVTQTVPLNLTVSNPGAGATPFLDLHLDPIHLDLLGLTVDTSPICLSITAQSGPGNLLGNLLGGLLGGLDTSATPLALTDVLGSLSTAQVSSLLDGVLQPALNAGLDQLLMPSSVNGASVTPGTGATTNILHLSLGPVDLNLLGLDIHLDNCSDGPVTVDIGAQSGPGKLLGNLLGGLAHSLEHAPAGALAAHLNTLGRIIGRLV
jgi:hypothetical protein